ncbi:MAG: aminotransferase class I/II-fold pyridoxal phosphate-dependent enzyme, partial [Oscillospiraceae bacterium]
TCSKAIGMAGIRLGFSVAGEKLTNALKMVKSPYNTDSISQKLGETVFGMKSVITEKTAEIINRNKFLLSEMKRLQGKHSLIFKTVYESVTNFVFIKTDYYSEIFYALMEKSIIVRKFNGYIRINTGSVSENTILINALEEILFKIEEGLK